MEMEFPQCPKCLDIYGINKDHIKAPKIIQCGDSICKECLDEILKKDESEFFQCPVCNDKIKKNQNIDDYTTNKELIRIINPSFNIRNPEEEDEKGDNNKSISFNIITLGSSGVGKTSIFKRLLYENYEDYYQNTIVINYLTYFIKYKKKNTNLYFMIQVGKKNLRL